MPLLLKSADPRLIFVSGLGRFSDCVNRNWPLPPDLKPGWPKKEVTFETVGYRCTKVALNMLMLDYHWKLENDGVKVWAVLPGFLVTDLGGGRDIVGKMGAQHPSAGGQLMRKVLEGERDDQIGRLIDKNGIREF